MLSRLSGSTAEFLSMWNIMMTGHNPFILINQEIDSSTQISNSCPILSLRPILPSWLFDPHSKTVSFTFLGTIHVIYRNPHLINTWDGVSFHGNVATEDGENFPTISDKIHQDYFSCDVVRLIRERKIQCIDISIL